MLVENLETRRLLSHTLVGGVLTITGTSGKDLITLKLQGAQIRLSDDGAITSFTAASIQSIVIQAGDGNDTITSDDAITAPTTLYGGPGNDSLRGGGGEDFLSGAGGNDTMDGGLGADTMFGGSGTDTVTYASRTADLNVTIDDASNDGEAGENDDVGSGVENVIGGSGDDSIVGSAGNNSLMGGPGNDTLLGAAGNDTIDGGLGADSMSGGDGLDTITYASRTAPVFVQLSNGVSGGNGEAGENDQITDDFETIIGGSGNDTIQNFFPFALLPNLLIEGGLGNDTLAGSYGDDTVLGGAGDDYIFHTHGNDLIDGGSGVNTFDLEDHFETTGATLSLDGIANDGFPGETQNVLNIRNIHGSQFADTIIGDGQDNHIDGGSGANFIDGGAGNDTITTSVNGQDLPGGTIYGGAGNDRIAPGLASEIVEIHGGAGDDTIGANGFFTKIITGDAGNDLVSFDDGGGLGVTFDLHGTGIETIEGTVGDDHFIGDDTDETFLGLAGNDTIEGNGGDDYIDGGLGDDVMLGGAGDDIFVNRDGITGDVVDGGPGIDFAEDGGSVGAPGHMNPVDTLTNIEFIYDPETNSAQPFATPLGVPALAGMETVTPDIATIPTGGSVINGILTITGATKNSSPAADNLSVILDSTGKNISVTQNGGSRSFSLSLVRGISIDTGGGNDVIALARSDGSRAVTVPVTVAGGTGNDTITGGAANDTLSGGDGNDSIHGGGGNDSIIGGLGNDTINGDAGDDILNGGVETLGVNVDGADNISGGPGNDSVIYSFRTDDLSIDISNGSKKNDARAGEGDSVNSDIENVFGGNGNDLIIGNSASNLISGGGGNDTIKGGDGNDKLIGGRGSDLVLGQGGINLYSIADGTRDDFDASGNLFVSGDVGVDFDTVTQTFLG